MRLQAIVASLGRVFLSVARGPEQWVTPIALIGSVITLSVACHAALPAHSSVFTTHSISVDGRLRTYVLYVPRRRAPSASPLVMVLHGQGGSGAQVLAQGHWRAAADRYGFTLLAPEGVLDHSDRAPSFFGNRRSWNAGPSIGTSAQLQDVDDVGFLSRVLDKVQNDWPIDRSQIYVTGFSNGAAMAFRIAAHRPGRFAAVAPVSNAVLVPVAPMALPTSLLLVWGTADPVNPIAGGTVRRAGITYVRPSADQSLLAWGRALGCADQVLESRISAGVLRRQLAGCPGESQAQLVIVDGLGHQWPGGKTYLRAISGPGSDALDATELIWRYFSAHRLSAVVGR